MTKNKRILSMLTITLLLSACGSSSADKEGEKTVQNEKKNNTQQEATKLVATPINANEELKGQKMKDEFSDWQRGRVQFLNLEGGF